MFYLEISEKDKENIKMLFPIIENYGYEIVDEVIKTFSKDEEAVKALQENNVSFEQARDSWFYLLKTVFSPEFSEESAKKISTIGKTYVDLDIKGSLLTQVAFLLLLKTIDKIISLNLDNFTDLLKSMLKLFAYSFAIFSDSYRKEMIDSFLELTGFNENLFSTQIKVARKRRREKSKVTN